MINELVTWWWRALSLKKTQQSWMWMHRASAYRKQNDRTDSKATQNYRDRWRPRHSTQKTGRPGVSARVSEARATPHRIWPTRYLRRNLPKGNRLHILLKHMWNLTDMDTFEIYMSCKTQVKNNWNHKKCLLWLNRIKLEINNRKICGESLKTCKLRNTLQSNPWVKDEITWKIRKHF